MRRIRQWWNRFRRWFPRVRDTGAVLIGLVVAADVVLQRFQHGHVAAVVETSFGVVAAVALWWRRSRPVLVTVIGIVVMFVIGVEYAALVAIATLMIRRRDRLSLALTAVAVPSMIIGSRLNDIHSRANSDVVSSVLNAVLTIGVVAALGAYIGVRRDLLTNLQDRAERAEAEREIREEQGRLGERTRIAREMHDVLAHKVSLIALQAGGLEVTNDPSAEQVRACAALIRETAHQALEDLRDVLGVLRDADGDVRTKFAPQAKLSDIAGVVESSRSAGQSVTLVGTADLTLPAGDLLGRAAFRLVQEALTNVHKHARSAATTVQIDGAPGGQLEIEVVNLAPVAAGQLLPGSGLGLVGLRERVELVGGTFAAGPTRAGGFRVCASMPWPPQLPTPAEAADLDVVIADSATIQARR